MPEAPNTPARVPVGCRDICGVFWFGLRKAKGISYISMQQVARAQSVLVWCRTPSVIDALVPNPKPQIWALNNSEPRTLNPLENRRCRCYGTCRWLGEDARAAGSAWGGFAAFAVGD